MRKTILDKIKENVLRQELSHRGGGIEISLKRTFTSAQETKIEAISTTLAWYMHSLTNHEEDEWESATFEENQSRPSSAY